MLSKPAPAAENRARVSRRRPCTPMPASDGWGDSATGMDNLGWTTPQHPANSTPTTTIPPIGVCIRSDRRSPSLRQNRDSTIGRPDSPRSAHPTAPESRRAVNPLTPPNDSQSKTSPDSKHNCVPRAGPHRRRWNGRLTKPLDGLVRLAVHSPAGNTVIS